MNEQELKKSVEKIVNDILAKEAETVEKAMPSSTPANGGEDKIKSGSPFNEQQAAEAKKKEDEAKKAEAEKLAAEDLVSKAKDDKKEEKKDDKDEDDKKDKKKDDKKPAFMKKSIDELSAHLSDDELELIKAWREEETETAEPVAKSLEAPASAASAEDLTKTLTKVIEDQIGGLKKSLDEKDSLIKGLNEKIEKIASQPAYDRRSISTLETLEKGGATQSDDISKSQVLNKMLEMQVNGKGVTSHHIAEFESTSNISDHAIRNAVFKEFKLN